MQKIRNMPIGVQSFEAMRLGNFVYVDKTQFIPKLEKLSIAYFFARPRRFGKSLFISTLQAYFEGRKELFKGLAIEKFKAEAGSEWQKYPVLKLDLNAQKYTKEDDLTTILNENISMWEEKYNVKTSSPDPISAFTRIIQLLHEKFNKRVVILIDEYDKPLIATLENEELHEQYRSTLKAFYSVIKSSNDYIHLSFLTGVTKFSKVSIFSDLNNLFDISFDREYSSLCGITEEELLSNFEEEVQALATEYNQKYDEMLDVLRARYDGYRFSEKEERIYNPFSLFNVFAKNKLGDYWFATGTPTFLVRLLEQRYFDIQDLEGNIQITADDINEYRIGQENLIPLLFQTGYLTVKDYREEGLSYVGRYTLGYPNDEVKYAMVKRLMKIYIDATASFNADFKVDKFESAMRKGDIERVLTLIKALMASIPYDSLPEDKLFLREQNYQTTIYLIFRLMGEYVRTEVHSSQGRSDVEVETADSIYIFEFKVGGKPQDAIAQIKETGYAEKHKASNKNIFLIGATIARGKRTLGKWVVEKVLS
ncbi:MAG: AAA family ATPase [Treponema sp.]